MPPNVAAAVRTALEKLPADRFATAGDFARALSDERAMTPTGARRTARPTTGFWRRLTIACFIAIAGLTGLLIRAARSPRTAPSPWRVTSAFPDSAWPLGQLGLSPDGNSIVYEAGGEHGVQLWVRDAMPGPVPIPGSNIGSEWPTFSPDGQRIPFFAADGVFASLHATVARPWRSSPPGRTCGRRVSHGVAIGSSLRRAAA